MVDASGLQRSAMNTGLLITILVIVIIVVLVAVLLGQRRRTQRLQQQFGPEYQRTVARTGDQRSAEADLAARQQRHRELNIVALEPAARDRYVEAWRATQGRFVDDPAAATREADTLVARVMRDRGYPVDDFEQRAADVSVDHPQVAENYRAAHAVYQANEQGLAGTDDLRQAFVHYRSLFSELLDVEGDGHKEAYR
jgi:hypothetical protein